MNPLLLVSRLSNKSTFNGYISSSWIDYFPGLELPFTVNGITNFGNLKINVNQNFYIFNSMFISLNDFDGEGGAISTLTNIYALIKFSTFLKCRAKGRGGALHLKYGFGYVLDKVYAINCYSLTAEGHFCDIATENSINHKNYYKYTSVTNLHSNSNKGYTFRITTGEIKLINDNISRNYCFEYCAIKLSPTNVDGRVTGFNSYTSICNNTTHQGVGIGGIIGLSTCQKHEWNACNIVGNQEYGKDGIICMTGYLTIKSSFILNNNKDYNCVFNGWSKSTITFINCSIDRKTNGPNVKFIDQSPSSNKVTNDLSIETLELGTYYKTTFLCPTDQLLKRRRIHSYYYLC